MHQRREIFLDGRACCSGSCRVESGEESAPTVIFYRAAHAHLEEAEQHYHMFADTFWSLDDDEEVSALLRTSVGVGVALLLIQHKVQLSRKIVGKVILLYKDWETD
jgi:hypothetical protein